MSTVVSFRKPSMTSFWQFALHIASPLLFLLYMNDLPNGLNSNVNLFADEYL